MQISKEELWDSVGVIIPTYNRVREAKVHLNLPSVLKDCAVLLFVANVNELQMTTGYYTACRNIRAALLELSTYGYMTFDGEKHEVLPDAI